MERVKVGKLQYLIENKNQKHCMKRKKNDSFFLFALCFFFTISLFNENLLEKFIGTYTAMYYVNNNNVTQFFTYFLYVYWLGIYTIIIRNNPEGKQITLIHAIITRNTKKKKIIIDSKNFCVYRK